jgi:hypothetical protein
MYNDDILDETYHKPQTSTHKIVEGKENKIRVWAGFKEPFKPKERIKSEEEIETYNRIKELL